MSGPNLCQCSVDADCGLLDDGDLCNGAMFCVDATCQIDPDSMVTCPPSSSICLMSTCEPVSGACVTIPAADGTPCTDGDLCTLVDVSVGGACVGGASWFCDDGDLCTEDHCDGASGCESTPIPNCGVGCGDDLCTGDETCDSCALDCGLCPLVCGDGDCSDDETCGDCPADCGTCPDVCGDASCSGEETVLTCHADCAPWWMNPTAAENFHGAAFLADSGSCGMCHGANLNGGVQSCESCHGGWKTNCTFCHGGIDNQTGAPPSDLLDAVSSGAVGAHSVHVEVTAKSGALGCAICHAVPLSALTPGHIDGDGQAEVSLSDCAGGIYASGSCSSVYCHGDGSTPSAGGAAVWSGGSLGCQSCHTDGGLDGKHGLHLSFGFGCSSCHEVSGTTFANPSTHADCNKDVKAGQGYDSATKTCSSASCHGAKTW